MTYIPLADQIRPKDLNEFVGQEHLVGKGKILHELINQDRVGSMILWGPPGSGKTTLAKIIARKTEAQFVQLSATLAGVKDIREVVKKAKDTPLFNRKTILFIDEIHRFNKAQQDSLLPHVENGTLILIGATTENPSFEVNSALLSRTRVLILKALKPEHIEKIVKRAIQNLGVVRKQPSVGAIHGQSSVGAIHELPQKAIRELPQKAIRERPSVRAIHELPQKAIRESPLQISNETLDTLIHNSNGDARVALNALELAIQLAGSNGKVSLIHIKEALQNPHLRYGKNGEEHYNIISAFIKSMRASNADASLYYLARMIEGGEDPKFIARRMVIFASEDVGMAQPTALVVANEVFRACETIGYPECAINLAHGVVYLAKAKKDRNSYDAYFKAVDDVKKFGNLPVPMNLRNAPTKLMKDLGYGKGYEKYSKENLLPNKLKGKKYLR